MTMGLRVLGIWEFGTMELWDHGKLNFSHKFSEMFTPFPESKKLSAPMVWKVHPTRQHKLINGNFLTIYNIFPPKLSLLSHSLSNSAPWDEYEQVLTISHDP